MDGNGVPKDEPSTFLDQDETRTVRGNLLLTDHEWYQELRERYKNSSWYENPMGKKL